VRAFRCVETHAAQNTNGNRPPRNGPYNDQTEGKYYSRPGTGGTNYPQPFESSVAPFANRYWNISEDTAVSRYNTGEQTLLPRGVGVQLMIQPTPATVATGAPNERYVRTGVIMFDPQGRLTLRNFSLEQTDTLGQYVQLAAGSVARNIVSGVGLALYDATIFKAQETFSESDAIYQRAPFTINAPTNPAFTDFKLVTDETADANPATTTEEEWLDANATPLIIDRYTGSMSEAQ
jgi:hypothetical protein